MGFFRDFKEYLDLKRGKTYLTNELYIAELGEIEVSESYSSDTKSAQFFFDRYVIVQKATGKEVRRHLIQKYGSYFGEPDITTIRSRFEKPENTTYYKLVTMNNKLMPSATPKSILHNADPGVYQVIKHAKTLNGLKKNKNIRFADVIDLDSIKELEEIVNHTPDFTM